MASGESIRFERTARLRIALYVVACLSIVACSGASYSGREWTARVVDMDTGAPIEGAIVVARWQLERYTGRFAGWLLVSEGVTDKEGFVHFADWGPLAAPSDAGMRTRMGPCMPYVYVFKSGYRLHQDSCCGESSDPSKYGGSPGARTPWANGKIFGLELFRQTTQAYREYLDTRFPLGGPPCSYMDTPQIFAAGATEDRHLKARIGRGIPHLSIEGLQANRDFANCAQTVRASIGRFIK
jgi:hypothetical protein